MVGHWEEARQESGHSTNLAVQGVFWQCSQGHGVTWGWSHHVGETLGARLDPYGAIPTQIILWFYLYEISETETYLILINF